MTPDEMPEELKKKLIDVLQGKDTDTNVNFVSANKLKEQLNPDMSEKEIKEFITDSVENMAALDTLKHILCKNKENLDKIVGNITSEEETIIAIRKAPNEFINYAVNMAMYADMKGDLNFGLGKQTSSNVTKLHNKVRKLEKQVKLLTNQISAQQKDDVLKQADEILNETDESEETNGTNKSSDSTQND